MGLALALAHPGIPSCASCRAWLYDAKTWRPAGHGGRPVPRPKGVPTPCGGCPKSEDRVTPNPAAELSDKNWRAWHWFQLLEADDAKLLPRDFITISNGAAVKAVQGRLARAERAAASGPLFQLAAVLGGRDR